MNAFFVALSALVKPVVGAFIVSFLVVHRFCHKRSDTRSIVFRLRCVQTVLLLYFTREDVIEGMIRLHPERFGRVPLGRAWVKPREELPRLLLVAHDDAGMCQLLLSNSDAISVCLKTSFYVTRPLAVPGPRHHLPRVHRCWHSGLAPLSQRLPPTSPAVPVQPSPAHPPLKIKLCSALCRFGISALGTSTGHFYRIRRTLYDGR